MEALKEAARVTLTAETTYTTKTNGSKNPKKEYGNPEDADMSDLVAIARAGLVQTAINEATTAEDNVRTARARLEKVQCDLRNLFEGGTETDDSVFTLPEEIRLED